MAIEDEIINITDLDVGTELLNTDKLLIETNNGTKLLSFKDFVISVDNINFVDRLLDTTGTGATYEPVFIEVGGYNLLSNETAAGHKPTYGDLRGTFQLLTEHESKVTLFTTVSANIDSNTLGIQDLITNLGTIQSLLAGASALSATQISLAAVNFKQSGAGTIVNNRLSFTSSEDVTPVNSNVTYTSNPFKITYPDDDTYIESLILFSGSIILKSSSDLKDKPLQIIKGDKPVRTIYRTAQIGTQQHVYEFNHVEYVKGGESVEISCSTNAPEIDSTSSFSGIKLNG